MGGKIFLAGLLAPFYLASATEVLSTLDLNGVIYSNVTVTKVSATDIFFTSSNGMGNAKLKNLDREMQQHFHYNSAKAKETEMRRAADAAQYHRQLVQKFPGPYGGQTNAPAAGEKQIWAKSYLNHQAPELFVERWLTPMPDYRGKFILYDFWATTSPACRAEIQELKASRENSATGWPSLASPMSPKKLSGP